ncbi:MAG: ATP-binding cassette domain-containing protein [Ornithinibacter sp.]
MAAPPRGRIEVRGLTWRPFGRRDPVLRDVTLVIEPGERVLLVGPSGSGKSTLLRALAGLLETADAGEVTGSVLVDGAAPGARPGAVGLVLQEPGAGVVAATVARDVAFGPENVAMPRAAMPAVVASALASVGLGDLPLDTPTSALSGGQTQRLALAGTLALDPSVVLLDEPTAMLDPASAREVRDAVAALASGVGWPGAPQRSPAGAPAHPSPTLVVVEHVLEPWVDLVERLVVLDDDGRVVADGPVREVLDLQLGRLLDMGIWVPGEPPPEPVAVDPVLVAPWQTAVGTALVAEPLAVERTTRLLDGSARTARAAVVGQRLEATAGSLTVLVGPSGSGKSTVLHALAGFLAPTDEGAVTVPTPVSDPARRSDLLVDSSHPGELSAPDLARALAWVPQWSSSTIVAGTVLEEVLATTRALEREDAGTADRARALLAALGLAHLESADPRELSGGEQRRLAVAAALLHGPPVLLADEPTVGQDRRTWAALVGLVAAYRSSGGSVIAATHDAHVIDRATTTVRLLAPERPAVPLVVRTPLLARCGPLALMAGALLAVPAGVLSPHWSTSVVVLGVQAALAVLGLTAPGRGPRPAGRARRVALRMIPGLIAALSVGWSTWFLAGHDVDAALTVALRVLVIVLPSAVLIPFIDPDELGDHLAQRLGMPDRPVVATAAALQRVQSFGAIWSEMSRARRVRGIGVSWRRPRTVVAHVGALTMGLLVRTLRAAAELAVAMDARGFATAQARSWWKRAPWHWGDSLLVALATVPLGVAILVR